MSFVFTESKLRRCEKHVVFRHVVYEALNGGKRKSLIPSSGGIDHDVDPRVENRVEAHQTQTFEHMCPDHHQQSNKW